MKTFYDEDKDKRWRRSSGDTLQWGSTTVGKEGREKTEDGARTEGECAPR